MGYEGASEVKSVNIFNFNFNYYYLQLYFLFYSFTKHSFFNSIEWSQLLDSPGPFLPNVESSDDTSYFERRGSGMKRFFIYILFFSFYF